MMSSWTNSGVNFYSEDGVTSIAEFGSNEARIGAESDRHVTVDDDSFDIMDGTIVRATFGDEVRIGRVSEYNTVIDSNSFDISSGYEPLFSINAPTAATKSITVTPLNRAGYAEGSASSDYRDMSLWIQRDITYTFNMYRTSGVGTSITFNTSVDGTTARTKTMSYASNSATLTFTPAVDSDGNSGMSCSIRQTYSTGYNEPYMYQFYVEYTKSIRAPQMSFVGDINLTDGSHYKLNGKKLDYVVEYGDKYEEDWDTNVWYYEKWSSGKIEAWCSCELGTLTMAASGSLYRSVNIPIKIPSGIFPDTPTYVQPFIHYANSVVIGAGAAAQSKTLINAQIWKATNNTNSVWMRMHAVYYPPNYFN